MIQKPEGRGRRGQSREREEGKTRKEVKEDREITDLSAMVK